MSKVVLSILVNNTSGVLSVIVTTDSETQGLRNLVSIVV